MFLANQSYALAYPASDTVSNPTRCTLQKPKNKNPDRANVRYQVANLKNVEYGMSIILSELYTNKRAAACLTSIQSTHCAIMLTDLHREHYACHSMVTYHGYTE